MSLALIVTTSCTFFPTVSKEQSYADSCEMLTKELTLSVEVHKFNGCGGDTDAGACLLFAAIGVPAVTFVVSGSVILVGNTLHWLEYQGICDEGFLVDSVTKLKARI